ncbi:hypothetical protein [Butyricimonas faecihominis]|jgi:hypothetical protein|uniref:hypothetical protein n=1 Tax=Butyricimonas faecihominis TaxID=1472416 RepID=UPI00266EF1AB|nr:hypothetical protein [Butyricimonas faecihominis]
MKKLKFVPWIFLACFRVFVPMEVSGQSMVLIERDTFRMYSNPLNADSILATKVYDRVYSPPYIRDASAYYGWWRLQGDSLFLEKIEDHYGTMRSDDHEVVFMDLGGIFDNYVQDGKVFASWFSGELDVIGGKCIRRGALGFRSDYEDEWIYRVENGRIMSKATYRNELRESTFSYVEAGDLIETLFDGDRFPELANKYLLAKVQVTPRPDGTIDSLGLAVRVVSNKAAIGQVRDDDEQWVENDYSNPYIQELKECVQLVPEWEYVKLRGRVHAPLIEVRAWEGKGCKAICSATFWVNKDFDEITVNGKTYNLENYPFQYNTNLYARIRPLLRGEFTRFRLRGYIGYWEIRDDKLYLLSLRRVNSWEIIPLDVVFPGNGDSPVEATWYTGKLRLSDIRSAESDYSSRHGRGEIFYKVKKGKVIKRMKVVPVKKKKGKISRWGNYHFDLE